MSEAGLPDFKSVGWFGLLAPAGTDSAIVKRLNEAVVEANKTPKVIKVLRTQGIEPKNDSPAEFAAFIGIKLELHRKLAKQMHLDVDRRSNVSYATTKTAKDSLMNSKPAAKGATSSDRGYRNICSR